MLAISKYKKEQVTHNLHLDLMTCKLYVALVNFTGHACGLQPGQLWVVVACGHS